MSKEMNNKKYNEGCIKIFKLLTLLYKNKADYNSVLEIFSQDGDNESQQVILNKYLNTLKVFGIKINKVKGKYTLTNLPFATKFSIDDLKSISLFEKIEKYLPTSQSKLTLNEFIEILKYNFNDNTNLNYSQINTNDDCFKEFYYSGIKSQIETCEKHIQNNLKVIIKYKDNKEIKSIQCQMKSIVYDNKNVFVRVFKINEKIYEDILITKILEINATPSINTPNEFAGTVIYKLTGRLAKSYKLKENEYTIESDDKNSITIVNKNEPINKLIKRLLRYDYNCEVQRPKWLREKMKNIINEIIKRYED